MAIVKLPDGMGAEVVKSCAICGAELSLAAAVVGPVQPDGAQAFFCEEHLKSSRILVRRCAEYMAGQRRHSKLKTLGCA